MRNVASKPSLVSVALGALSSAAIREQGIDEPCRPRADCGYA